jgi:hypothetical protein
LEYAEISCPIYSYDALSQVTPVSEVFYVDRAANEDLDKLKKTIQLLEQFVCGLFFFPELPSVRLSARRKGQ